MAHDFWPNHSAAGLGWAWSVGVGGADPPLTPLVSRNAHESSLTRPLPRKRPMHRMNANTRVWS